LGGSRGPFYKRVPWSPKAFFPAIAPLKSEPAVEIFFRKYYYIEMRLTMHNEFTAIIEKDEDWYIAYSPGISGANGQGRTLDEARQSLADAISLILEDRMPTFLKKGGTKNF
jgi:predicted RNase H-like HicB family nuclease